MKYSAHESDESHVHSLTPSAWVQPIPLAIETLLLMTLFVVLGTLCLEYTLLQLGIASCTSVPLLVTFMAIFGAYRDIKTTNAAKLFSNYLLSFLMAGSVFLLSVGWLTAPALDYRFEAFFLIMAFFMLNTVRPLLFKCSDR